MKIPDKFQPHLAACKDGSRYLLQNVCLRDGLAIATDGRMLVAALTSDEDLLVESTTTMALLPAAAAKVACKKRPKSSLLAGQVSIHDQEAIVWESHDHKVVHRILPREDVEKFPKIDSLFPIYKKPFTLNLNAKMLATIAAALGEEKVSLTFDLENAGLAITVEAKGMDDRIGLLMPLRLHDEKPPNRVKTQIAELP